MNRNLTISERLKDLRVERGLNLEELSAQTGLSKSALGSYEAEDGKDISHRSIVALARFYGVSADYLLGLTEIKNHPNAALNELHLSDEMIEVLKSEAFNPRLLCEMAAHPEFIKFLTDAEIYVDGLAAMQIQTINSYVDVIRAQILDRFHPDTMDLYLRTLDAAHISEDDYFCNAVDRDLNAILRDLREKHKKDSNSAEASNPASDLKQALEEAANYPGSREEKHVIVLCRQLGIDYDSLTPEEFRVLIKVLSKAKRLQNPIPQRGKYKYKGKGHK